jgi:hypothetical protein
MDFITRSSIILVLKYLMKGTDSDFYLFDEEDKITKEDRKINNLFYLLKILLLLDHLLYLIDIMKQVKQESEMEINFLKKS